MTRPTARLTRRQLLGAGAALGLGASAAAAPAGERACIFVVCAGGPSQLDTWDPKPDAPAGVRGPYGALRTTVAGLRFAETLPRLARLAGRFAVIRTLHHAGDDLHETGLQRIQTGAGGPGRPAAPCLGAAVAAARGARPGVPAHVVLPGPLGDFGLPLATGQGPGFLGPGHAPFVVGGDPLAPDFSHAEVVAAEESPWETNAAGCGPADPCGPTPAAPSAPYLASPALRAAFDLRRETGALRARYGRDAFGASLLLARRLVEHGVRVVTVNQFPSLFGGPTWDCHGLPDLPTRVADVGDRVARPFDRSLAALVADLVDRGLWDRTVVCAVGEFGRSPEINPAGGREHWTRCWSALIGGGGLRGGLAVGESDARAAEPRDRPVAPAELLATLHERLGVPSHLPGPAGPRRLLPADARPIRELL